MAATRKLQGEIDRCLKKVTEGVETFEDIWQKVHNATNSNQKEKYEADLKKEIKKLQRLRDQIKSWIASGEIKDKTSLMEYRRLIETQMERFKVVERETKTKAYSKEGLGAAQKLDPAQREKEEISSWLQTSISQLQIQTDTYECEIESILAAKKKRLAKEMQDKLDDLKSKLERHKFHLTKLETLLRMLDNDSVDVDQIKKIKDDVEYYIESSQEPDFEENEYIYDDITGLDEVELDLVGGITSVGTTESNNSNCTGGGSPTSITSTSSPIQSPTLKCNSTPANNSVSQNLNSETASVDYNDAKKSKSENSIVNNKVTPVKPTAVQANKIELNNSTVSSVVVAPPSSVGIVPTVNDQPINKISSSQIKTVINSTSTIKAPSFPAITAPPVTTPTTNAVPLAPINSIPISTTAPIAFSVVAKSNLDLNSVQSQPAILQNHTSSNHNNNQQLQQNNTENHVITNNTAANQNSISKCVSPTSSRGSPLPANITSPPQALLMKGSETTDVVTPGSVQHVQHQQTPDLISIKNAAMEAITRNNVESAFDHPQITQQPQLTDTLQQSQQQSSINMTTMKSTETKEATIPPLLGVAPLGPLPLQKEHQIQYQMMEAAFHHLPTPSDSERLRPYLPRQPFNTPTYYPQTQLPHSDTLEFYQRLYTETLFFIFYYMEGTRAQYLAAKALKKQSWRFHTKYMMWFQRHEEPKVINEEFEQGTYIYFDYEKWGQRKKEGFTFEYKYLEDKDLN